MATVGAFEAKTHFAQLLARAERGEEITITRRGKVVARLVPAAPVHDPEAAKATFRRLRQRAREQGLGEFDWTRADPEHSRDGRARPRQLDRVVLVSAGRG